MEWLAVQFRRGDLPVALKLPGEDRGVFVIVAQRFAFGSLMFLTEMRAARFIASQRVDAHQLCEFEKIGDTSGALERLIKIFAFTRNANFAPEILFADHEKSGDVTHQIVINPEAAHGVMDSGVNPHWNFVGVFAGDFFVNFKQISVAFADGLFAETFDRVGEIEINTASAGPNT